MAITYGPDRPAYPVIVSDAGNVTVIETEAYVCDIYADGDLVHGQVRWIDSLQVAHRLRLERGWKFTNERGYYKD